MDESRKTVLEFFKVSFPTIEPSRIQKILEDNNWVPHIVTEILLSLQEELGTNKLPTPNIQTSQPLRSTQPSQQQGNLNDSNKKQDTNNILIESKKKLDQPTTTDTNNTEFDLEAECAKLQKLNENCSKKLYEIDTAFNSSSIINPDKKRLDGSVCC
jgi:hypothetical protein